MPANTKHPFGVEADTERDTLTKSELAKLPLTKRLQYQKKILYTRLKVPPAIAQFQLVLDKNTTAQVLKFLNKYRPETYEARQERLQAEAAAIAGGKASKSEKPLAVEHGLSHVVRLIEQKKPQLVLIADDVDPIELVIYLPALCRKLEVPFAIVKGKARLGTLIHRKSATVVAITKVASEDQHELDTLVDAIKANWAVRFEENRRKWGGGILSKETIAKLEARRAAAAVRR